MSSREAISTSAGPAPVGIYSQAIQYGGLLFCSGQLPLDPATGQLIEGDMTSQARRCLANLDAICRAAGTELRKAVHVRVFVVDIAALPAINVAYGEYFDAEAPARTSLAVAALPMGATLEVDAIVAVP